MVRKIDDVFARIPDIDMLHPAHVMLQLLKIRKMLEKLFTNLSIINQGLLFGDSDRLKLSFFITCKLVLLNSSGFSPLKLCLVIKIPFKICGTLVTPLWLHDSLLSAWRAE